MKIACFILCLSVQTILSSITYAETVQRCHMCGMDSSESQTEFVAHLDNGDMEHICCLHCVYILEKLMKDRKIVRLETRDYRTGILMDAETSYYLEGSSVIPKGSMAPFLPAFASMEEAEKVAKKQNGNILTFNKAMEVVARFDEEVGAG